VLAIEAKLGQAPEERDVRHFARLRRELGDELADALSSRPVRTHTGERTG
jgi:hypothetical protein